MVYFRPSEMKTGALKAKLVPLTKKVRRSAELKTNDEVNKEAALEKLPGSQMSETFMIVEEDNKIQVDVATTEVENAVYVKGVVNSVPDTNGPKKFGGGCAVVEASDETGEVEAGDYTSEDAGSKMGDGDDGMKEKIIHENALDYITEITATEFAALDFLSEKNNSMNKKVETAAPLTMVNMVVDQEAGMREQQEKENVLKEAQVELQDIMEVSQTDQDDSPVLCPNSFQAKVIGEKEGNLENTVEVCSSVETLIQILE